MSPTLTDYPIEAVSEVHGWGWVITGYRARCGQGAANYTGLTSTVWGVTASDFNLSWVNGQGAANYTGLTLHATAPGLPVASLTLAGLTSADLTNGKLSISFGRTQDLPGLSGSNYMQIHAN